MFLKKLFSSVVASVAVVALVAGVSTAQALDFDDVVEVSAPIKGVFIPQGFDNNDNAQVVVEVALPNSCYKMGMVKTLINPDTKSVNVSVTSFYRHSSACLQIYTTYPEVVSLGLLDVGNYAVNVNSTTDYQLPVALATNDSADDFVYANVLGLVRQSTFDFQIQGRLPRECAQLREIRVLREEGGVMVVLPIVEFPEGCDLSTDESVLGKEFLATFTLPTDLKGDYLIHVRSFNGGSLNQVVNFK